MPTQRPTTLKTHCSTLLPLNPPVLIIYLVAQESQVYLLGGIHLIHLQGAGENVGT